MPYQNSLVRLPKWHRFTAERNAADNPVRRAYEPYLAPPTRPSRDPIATLYAVRPNAKFRRLHKGGDNHIFPIGTHEWRDHPNNPPIVCCGWLSASKRNYKKRCAN